ncbi:hypothetical protein ACFLS8_00965 [Chloroflexota bacterium]
MELARTFNGKKFMWDGRTYENLRELEEVGQSYQTEGFDIEIVEEDGQSFIFTRKVVEAMPVEEQSV